MSQHPELVAEQAYIDHAYECLDRAREQAIRLRGMTEVGRGGTRPGPLRARRDRRDRRATGSPSSSSATPRWCSAASTATRARATFYIGRLAVADERQEPVVVDWRAPVAEPFYRATGRAPMGLARRRHFAARAAAARGIEDELFGEQRRNGDGTTALGRATACAHRRARDGAHRPARRHRRHDPGRAGRDHPLAACPACSSCRAVPARARPSSRCTAPAYLLYTHRFPLEDQGVLVVGPNRLFLGYIEPVLPSLGEAGVEQVGARRSRAGGRRSQATDGDRDRVGSRATCAWRRSSPNAVRDRQRPLARDLVVPFGAQPAARSTSRRHGASSRDAQPARPHAQRGPQVRRAVPVRRARRPAAATQIDARTVRERTRSTDEVRAALEAMWPVLTPAQLLHDLFGSRGTPATRGASRPSTRARPSCSCDPGLSASTTSCGPTTTSRSSTKRSLCSARVPRGNGSRARGDAHVRAHRRRRGAGPLADGTADAHPPFAQRLDDRRR